MDSALFSIKSSSADFRLGWDLLLLDLHCGGIGHRIRARNKNGTPRCDPTMKLIVRKTDSSPEYPYAVCNSSGAVVADGFSLSEARAIVLDCNRSLAAVVSLHQRRRPN
jgi:hypothetical protein